MTRTQMVENDMNLFSTMKYNLDKYEQATHGGGILLILMWADRAECRS